MPTPTRANVEPSEDRGDIGVRGFYNERRMAIFDVVITDVDSRSSTRNQKSSKASLADAEKRKIRKYGDACTQMRRDFVPLAFSADGMPGTLASAAVQRLAGFLARKWGTAYSVTCGFVRTKISLSLCRSLTMCLRDPRDPTSAISEAVAPIVDGAGLTAYHLQ